MRRSNKNKPNNGDNDADRKHHGLVNQGATCYLNSVLQVLFMTKDFREGVKTCTRKNSEELIDPDLKALFQDLEKAPASTGRITKKMGIEMVHDQHDAAEFFEKILEMIASRDKQIFRGLLGHFVCCDECGKESVQDQQFWYLPLSFGDISSEVYRVEDGIEEFLKTSKFTGENQMYCVNCNAKTDCTERNKVTHHPHVLTLLLKRFHFNFDTKTYTKTNREVLIPFTLDKPKSYQLYAVVEHSGELRRGHYVSIIQTDQDRWFRFNDDKVSPVQEPFKHGPVKSSKAYLLFYRIKTMPRSNKDQNLNTEKRRKKVGAEGKDDDAKHTVSAEQERDVRGEEDDQDQPAKGRESLKGERERENRSDAMLVKRNCKPVQQEECGLKHLRGDERQEEQKMEVDDSEVQAAAQGTKNQALAKDDGESAKIRRVTFV